MSDQPEPQPEETDEAKQEAKPETERMGFQYPPPPGQTEYGTYQNPRRQ
jgi:hypothetical protein